MVFIATATEIWNEIIQKFSFFSLDPWIALTPLTKLLNVYNTRLLFYLFV